MGTRIPQAVLSRIESSEWYEPDCLSIHAEMGYKPVGGISVRLDYGLPLDAETWFHDLGHMLAFVHAGKPERLLLHNFGFEYKTTVEVLGREYIEPITMAATDVELRAVAFQARLMYPGDGGAPSPETIALIADGVNALRIMADFLCVPKTRAPQDEPEALYDGANKCTGERARLAWAYHRCMQYWQTFTDAMTRQMHRETIQYIQQARRARVEAEPEAIEVDTRSAVLAP